MEVNCQCATHGDCESVESAYRVPSYRQVITCLLRHSPRYANIPSTKEIRKFAAVLRFVRPTALARCRCQSRRGRRCLKGSGSVGHRLFGRGAYQCHPPARVSPPDRRVCDAFGAVTNAKCFVSRKTIDIIRTTVRRTSRREYGLKSLIRTQRGHSFPHSRDVCAALMRPLRSFSI